MATNIEVTLMTRQEFSLIEPLPNVLYAVEGESSVKNWSNLENLSLLIKLTPSQIDLLLWELYQIPRARSGGSVHFNMVGGEAPSGQFQPCQNPPVSATTPGKEMAYELVNDSLGTGINKWTSINTK